MKPTSDAYGTAAASTYGLGSCDGIDALSLQMMVERASAGDVDPIDAAAELLLDFINIFLRISPPNVIFKRDISLLRDSKNESRFIVMQNTGGQTSK